MATLRGRAPKDTFNELLKINGGDGVGLTDELLPVGDGSGANSPLLISKNAVSISSLILGGKALPDSTSADPGEALTVGNDGSLTWALPKAIEDLPTLVTYEYSGDTPVRVVSEYATYTKVEEYTYDALGNVMQIRTIVGDSIRDEIFTYANGLVVSKRSVLSTR